MARHARKARRQRPASPRAPHRALPPAAQTRPSAPARGAPLRPLVLALLALEGFLLALLVIAPLGGTAQSLSPLARAWPWLLAPARLLFGEALVRACLLLARGWPALPLFAVLLLGAACAQGVALVHALRRPASARAERWVVLLGALLLGLTLLLLPALPSDDIFSYILYGRISVVHGANPLIAAPADFSGDPFLLQVFWRDTRSVYGAVWLLLSSGIALVAERLGSTPAEYVLLFKLLGLAAHVANAALIWAILGRLAPARRLVGTLLYAWSPLALLEFTASAHNDAVMLTLLLLGVYLLLRGWEAWALVAIGLSIAVKYMPVVLLPFYAVLVVRRLRAAGAGWPVVARALAWRGALVAGVLLLTALPYWSGPATLGALLYSPPAQQLNNSLIDMLKWPVRAVIQTLTGIPYAEARTVGDTGLKLLALLAYLVLWLRQFRRVQSLEGMLAAWGWALFWYTVVASGWFWPWYVTWPLAVVALLPWGRLTVATLLLAAGALALYALLPLHSAPIYGYRALVAFGPVLAYLAWQRWGARLLATLPPRLIPRPG